MTKTLMSEIVDYQDVPDFLEHYGVKGMRWGVRKNRGSSSRAAAKQDKKDDKKPVSVERTVHLRIAPRPKTNVKAMTDDELRARISRLEMEKKLKELESPVVRNTQKGKTFTEKWIQQSGDILMKTAVQAVSAILVDRYIKARFATTPVKAIRALPPPLPNTRVG